MCISYEGIGHLSVTFPNSDAAENEVCSLNSEGKVCACATGGNFIGKVESVSAGQAAVQIGGFASVNYVGTAPAMGHTKLSADGAGSVKADADGTAYWVVAVDTANSTAVIKL